MTPDCLHDATKEILMAYIILLMQLFAKITVHGYEVLTSFYNFADANLYGEIQSKKTYILMHKKFFQCHLSCNQVKYAYNHTGRF